MSLTREEGQRIAEAFRFGVAWQRWTEHGWCDRVVGEVRYDEDEVAVRFTGDPRLYSVHEVMQGYVWRRKP